MFTNLQKRLSVLTLLVSAFFVSSCSGDDNEDGGYEPNQTINLICRGFDIEENLTVRVGELTSVTLSYNNLVEVDSTIDITLNDVVCEAGNPSTSKMKINIKLPAMDYGTEYTLNVPEGAIVATNDKKVKAPAAVLHFKTEKKLDISKAQAVTEMLGFGWNLGNHFDSYDDGNENANYRITWGNDCPYWDNVNPTESLYSNLAKIGVKTVRIPATWGPYENMTDGNYTIDANYMATIKQNVLWAKEHGLNVILNTHHDEYWQNANAASDANINKQIKDRISKTWKQIANAFKEEGDYLILETFNELNNNWKVPTNSELDIMNEWNQTVVDAIRETGGNNATRWIAIPSYQASPSYALNNHFQLPSDPADKLIVAVHCYDPYSFTLEKEDANKENCDLKVKTWGHNAGNSYDESNITNLLSKLNQTFIMKNIPCYLGEFGCSIHKTDLGEKCRAYYLEYFCRAAYNAGLAVTLWDNNVSSGGAESHGYINHKDGSYANTSASTLMPTMIKAATSTDSEYTLESIYEKAPK